MATALLLAVLAVILPAALAGLGRRAGSAGAGGHLRAVAALAALATGLATASVLLIPGDMRLSWPAPPDWLTLVWGLGTAGLFIWVIGGPLMRLPETLGLSGFERGMAILERLPRWAVAVSVLVGGVAEELLYRFVGFGLLTNIWGEPAAFLVASFCFGLAHWPLWGAGPAVSTAVSGAIFTGLYAVHGDLWACILAHVLIDAAGLLRNVGKAGATPAD